VYIDKFQYTLPYQKLIGGVFSISTEHYRLINGYSNVNFFKFKISNYFNLFEIFIPFYVSKKSYWGWGGEDDDLNIRLSSADLQIYRPSKKIARYKMMRHKQQEKLDDYNSRLLKKAKMRRTTDGLNSIAYKVIDLKLYTSFTYILVDIGEVPTISIIL